ncbi:peptidase T [Cloacibacillus evryensis]|uniref:peptidase T n=1 Tax=Cloacibacillus evryensis TaxID=508460 RepID=UPI0026716493|nr:peptidase T [Cloacibacillus evryensis]
MKTCERLLAYAGVASASDEKSENSPSAPGIWEMARLLKNEMEEMGLTDVCLDEHCYLYASIPANIADDVPVLGFIAHMDVSSASPCENIRPRVVAYRGGDIVLNEEKNIVMREADFPVLRNYVGKSLIVTDGTTLLGADDKAGIAEIMTMAERLLADDSIKHGRIAIAFTPDEEIGRGTEHFDLKKFGADFAYTVDGGGFGEISCENFNASSARVTFTGRSVHPGTAKNVMINAQLLAMEFFAMLPAAERPENTEGREGFFLLDESGGSVESAFQKYILRDHDARKLAEREEAMREAARRINEKYGEGRAELKLTPGYRNMAEVIERHPFMVEIAKEAVRAAGGEPFIVPIRGGTDGANLSFMGLPCPNLGTASHNHHGRLEFACVEDMERVVEMLIAVNRRLYAPSAS